MWLHERGCWGAHHENCPDRPRPPPMKKANVNPWLASTALGAIPKVASAACGSVPKVSPPTRRQVTLHNKPVCGYCCREPRNYDQLEACTFCGRMVHGTCMGFHLAECADYRQRNPDVVLTAPRRADLRPRNPKAPPAQAMPETRWAPGSTYFGRSRSASGRDRDLDRDGDAGGKNDDLYAVWRLAEETRSDGGAGEGAAAGGEGRHRDRHKDLRHENRQFRDHRGEYRRR